jgi:acetylornithine deacetylase/succinyl-diaminopimelate desuccinylase-like protein
MRFPDSPTALLQELVRIPSVNPDCAPGQGATGELACAAYIGGLLEALGAAVSYDEVLPGRPNVIGRFHDGGAGKPGLLLAPHVDTVSVMGMSVDPFAAEIRDGKIYGRGASDTKGTMAAMLWALHEMGDEIGSLSCAVTFVGLMGEEAGQPGSQDFAERYGADFSFALVGEPTSLDTVYAHKGCVWLKLSARGRSCHGSTPEEGENAIRRLLPVLESLVPWLEDCLPDFTDAILGMPTVNLGMIKGGSSPNIVPSDCCATLDFRETPALFEAGGALGLVTDFLESKNLQDLITLEVIGDSCPLLTDPSTDGIKKLESIGSRLTTAPWFCDAGRLAGGGIPSVACGPGSIAQAHTKDEYLAIADLEAGADFYRRFLETYR